MTHQPGPTELLDRMARELRPLLDELVFVGGATVGLLITDAAAEQPRVTRDVDAAARVSSRTAYRALEERLERLGFGPDMSRGAPLCRRVKGDLILDLLADDEEVLGFTNPWYASAIDTARPVTLPSGLTVQMVDAPHLIATKLVAWRDRGGSDWGSHDLEDIMLVVDGRPELLGELAASPADLRRFVADEVGDLLADPDLDDELPRFLGSDEVSQQRAVLLRQCLEAISAVGDQLL